MNLFDAANDEMKRMRNQRKDQSVIDRMEAFSATISRDELVYNLDLNLERVRDVYASPSVASSPVSLHTLLWLTMILRCFSDPALVSQAGVEEDWQKEVQGHEK